ncbi:acetyltransferase (GNAT) family protein [Saccharothrix saharensis]|uniref:Acetyltransferase (GNAT) family protein n=1 Tax=Saccharothrix saharensis TaxID=571190 RepID=A0A543JLE3_9PSEU|nr:GNAT family N-acetyltransferase [Saccharothrix saharensis]TQM83682.1 acetyltransferase (GNAT) family protein [Saccharothrix saharensis]
MDTTPKTWRLRVELDDSPGALARVTVRLADQDCNVLALSVIPVPGGVLDELVVQAAPGLLPADLVAAVRAEGGRCVGITAADLHDLVDAPTAALRAAALALHDPNAIAEALRIVMAADSVVLTPTSRDTTAPDREVDFPASSPATPEAAQSYTARRGWSSFTQVERARGQALMDLLAARGVAAPQPTALLTDDGMALVLRPGRAGDEDAVADLHSRCSMGTLFHRYHAGVRTVPRRWLHRLLSPPRGSTAVAQCADRVVALGQLIPMSTPDSAEVSLLVEDEWQGRGVGTALLGALAGAARAAGRRELVGWCLPAETGLVRTAARAGLPTSVRREDGLLRVSIATGGARATGPGRAESASRQVASG